MALPELTRDPVAARVGAGRIIGIDLARAIAMLGMVVAHYAWPDPDGGGLDRLVRLTDGRAMPLFVLLGGVGATILATRSARPDRTLLARAAMLYPLGIALQEATTFIAIILQSYALFFALTPVLRRLSTPILAGLAGAMTVAGSWTYQVVAPSLPRFEGPTDLVERPVTVVWELLLNGYYPLLPVGSFFLVGLVVGRLDLRSPRIATVLAVAGSAVALGTVLAVDAVVAVTGADPAALGPPEGSFAWTRLLDTAGHSEMPAWVLSATGSSLAILGAALLLVPRASTAVHPLVALGRLALSFYAFQAVLVRLVPHPNTTALGREVVTALAIYAGFAVFAVLWRHRFRDGPLEWLLRLGNSPRAAEPDRVAAAGP